MLTRIVHLFIYCVFIDAIRSSLHNGEYYKIQ